MPNAVILLWAATILELALAGGAWRRRRVAGATALARLMLAAAVWSLFYGVELLDPDLSGKLRWGTLEYIAIVAVPVAWLAFALHYSGRAHWLTRRRQLLLAVEPVVVLLAIVTNDWHHLMRLDARLQTSGPFLVLAVSRGPLFWVHVAYSYLMLLAGTVLLVGAYRRSAQAHRRQLGPVLAGTLAPWVANAVTLFHLSPLPGIDLTPFALAVTGLAFGWALFRGDLLNAVLDLAPLARTALIDQMADPVLVLDQRGHVVELNPAAERALGGPAATLLRRPAGQVLPGLSLDWLQGGHPGAGPAASREATAAVELTLKPPAASAAGPPGTPPGVTSDPLSGAPRVYHAVSSPLAVRDGQLAGALVVLRDVTERQRAEAALRATNASLGQALHEVAQREAALARQAAHLRLLNDLARAVSTSLDRRSIFLTVVQQLGLQLDARCCAVLHHDAAQQQLQTVARWAAGAAADYEPPECLPAGALLARLIAAAAPLVIHDQLPAGVPAGVTTLVWVPIEVGGVPWGALQVGFGREDAAAQDRVEFLQAVAVHLALAIRNARLYGDLREALHQLQEAQEQRVQQERLHALGQMARGIAHDLNNALAPVVGFSELLLLGEEDTQQEREYLELIHSGAQDAASVVRRLREFYRPRPVEEPGPPAGVAGLIQQGILPAAPPAAGQATGDGTPPPDTTV